MLELKKIRKSYEGIEVLKNINLKIEKEKSFLFWDHLVVVKLLY